MQPPEFCLNENGHWLERPDMPIVMDRSRIPTRLAEEKCVRPVGSFDTSGLQIAVINNMPDAALEDTELQFFNLLDTADSVLPVHLRLYDFPKIPRSAR